MDRAIPDRENTGCRIDAFGMFAFCLPLAVYLLTLAPTVTFFDSGEFITAISSLGSPHSPGYPLFVNYAKVFTFLPFGDIAFRVNFATAVSASLACLGVYLLTFRLSAAGEGGPDSAATGRIRRLACLSAALLFAFTPRLWLQSNHDKPYPLLSFLAAVIFLLLLKWREGYLRGEEKPAYVYLGAFVCGLALGAHQTIVLLVPSYAFLVLATDWRLIGRIKELLIAVSFFLVGCSVYLHMPVRATRAPILNWGDPQTLSRFMWSFLRKGYPMEHVDRDWTLFLNQLAAFDLVREFGAVGFVLLITGAVCYHRRIGEFIISCAIAVAVFLAFVVGYQNTPEQMIFLTEEFFTPLYLLAAVFIGLGLFALARPRVFPTDGMAKMLPLLRRFGVLPLLAVLPLFQCFAGYRFNDQHDNYLAYDYAVNTFRSLPPGAALFTWGDSGAFPLWYLQGVERMREDLVLLHVPHLQFDWYLDGFPKLFRSSILRQAETRRRPLADILRVAEEEQLARRPVFIDFSTRYSVEHRRFFLRQRGICYGLEKRRTGATATVDASVWEVYSLRGTGVDTAAFRDLDSVKAIQIYAYSRMEGGKALLDRGMIREGVKELRAAAAMDKNLLDDVQRILRKRNVKLP
ncbi:MAG: DUF2723 domain-containing protein [Geobacteraceae bacterium]|nr:DUF2723 domain-containing protein [Geobacteraceae bacterium]